ncbi:MAG: hypothetical protein L0387_30985 [Acidobacteria bacterium]|nr:hypothetical protein [Acidobacteriota bacterium]
MSVIGGPWKLGSQEIPPSKRPKRKFRLGQRVEVFYRGRNMRSIFFSLHGKQGRVRKVAWDDECGWCYWLHGVRIPAFGFESKRLGLQPMTGYPFGESELRAVLS